MAQITRMELLSFDSKVLDRLINAVPEEIQDQIIQLLADQLNVDSIEIPDEYLDDNT